MSSKITRFLSYVLVSLLTAAVTIFALGNRTAVQSSNKLFYLESLIQNYFIEDVNQKALEDAAANAMIQSLGDKWSYYLTAEEYASYMEQMNNAYVGIGVTIQEREDKSGLDVVQVTAGGPALEAGMQVGDVIVGVEGQSIQGKSTDSVKNQIKGAEGTKVRLTVLRNGSQIELTVTRRQIQTDVATYTMLNDQVGLVKIVNFDSRCAEETIAAIETLRQQGAKALIFDVRFNPGGYAKELVKVLDYLLPEGDLFRQVDYAGKETVDKSDAACLQMPMAVLINGNSFSAAEFFAAALQEYEWATVVGEKTTGKGYFQNTFQLPDGSAVGLSIGKYFTPKGVSLAQTGVTPDLPVEVDDETAAKIYGGILDPMEDPQILVALEALKNE